MNAAALVLAAGAGDRLNAGAPKAFVPVAGRPMFLRAAEAAAAAQLVDSVVVAVPQALIARARELLADIAVKVAVVAGGATRQQSARAALEAAGDPPAVAVHDAARCLCPPELFDRCIRALDGADAAIAAVPIADTLKRAAASKVVATIQREGLWAAQTPQAVRTELYRRAHRQAVRDGFEATDDAALVERLGAEVRIVEAGRWNMKVTTAEDLAVAEVLLSGGVTVR